MSEIPTPSPTAVLMDHINLSKSETRKMIANGGLNTITKGILSLMESAGSGDMKAVDIIVNRLDGLLTDRVAVKPIVVEVIDYGSK